MGRQAISTNDELLKSAIQQAKVGAQNQLSVWKRAADIYNGNDVKPISHSVVMLRAVAWGLDKDIPKGRKGRPPGTATTNTRQPQGQKVANNSPKYYHHYGLIHAPAGNPPVALKSFDDESILRWANATMEIFSPRRLSAKGLLYYVQHHFCSALDNPDQYESIAKVLRDNFPDPS